MSEPSTSTGGEPRRIGDYPVWSDSAGDVEVRFVGRGPDRPRDETLAGVEAAAPPVAMLRQVHSARVVEVEGGGPAGEADALVTGSPGLALSVITADCVPVLVAANGRLAAIHAGWRGIVAGVVPAGLSAIGDDIRSDIRRDIRSELAHAVVWIGPTIGPCCYEVGTEVADAVIATSAAEVAQPGPAGKPHLDLRRAVAIQLARAGVGDIRIVGPCTKHHPELLWSYRREGARAGRNIAYVWKRRAS
jgi:YfiH family protein